MQARTKRGDGLEEGSIPRLERARAAGILRVVHIYLYAPHRLRDTLDRQSVATGGPGFGFYFSRRLTTRDGPRVCVAEARTIYGSQNDTRPARMSKMSFGRRQKGVRAK